MVAGTVRTGDASTVEAKNDGQAMECHVVHDLIPGPIEECGVDGNDRAKAAHRHSSRTGDRMLFGDTDVEEPIGKPFLKRDQTRGSGHCSGDCDETRVCLALFDDCLGEGLGVSGDDCLRWADRWIKDGGVMEVFFVVVFSGGVATALLGEHVHEDWAFVAQFDRVVERVLHFFDVVPVERSDVANAERFEERRRLEEFTHASLERIHCGACLITHEWQAVQVALDASLASDVHRVEPDVGQRVAELAGDSVSE